MSALFSIKSLFWNHYFVVLGTVKNFYISTDKLAVWIKISV